MKKTKKNYEVKRRNLLPISHQKNHNLEAKLKKAEQEIQSANDRAAYLAARAEMTGQVLNETNEMLKESNFFKLFFLSFYKDYEHAIQT